MGAARPFTGVTKMESTKKVQNGRRTRNGRAHYSLRRFLDGTPSFSLTIVTLRGRARRERDGREPAQPGFSAEPPPAPPCVAVSAPPCVAVSAPPCVSRCPRPRPFRRHTDAPVFDISVLPSRLGPLGLPYS